MQALAILRRLAEQHSYSALRESCLEADSRDPCVHALAALADAQLGDTCAARRALESFDHAALSVDARVDVAAVHIALGELDDAIGILEADLPLHGDHALLLARLAWCRLQQGEHDQALVLYQRSLRIRPFMAVYGNLVQLYRDAGRLSDMATCLGAAWKFWEDEQANWPDDQRRVHSERLRALQLDLWLAQERFSEAETYVERQLDELDEGDWCRLLIDFAEGLAARDRHAHAEEWLQTGLHRFPQHVPLYVRLADMMQLHGRTREATSLLRRAIDVASARREPTAPLLLRLSRTALQFDSAIARLAAEQARDQLSERILANDIPEGNFGVEVALAAVDAYEGDYGAAERRYRSVLDQRPASTEALEGLGRLCMQIGRIDEAVALFTRVSAIDASRGHSALIAVRRFPEDIETLQRLENLARTPGIEGSMRAGLLFQLAAAWEKRADFAKAFSLVDEANAASRKRLRYDPAVHRRHCARIRRAFPRALYEHRPGCGHESVVPVFVVGMPRSGTTLVEQIIAGHSRIHGAGELGTIPRVIAGLERWERRTGSGRSYPECVDDLDARVIRGVAENILKELCEYAPDADHVVDKLPHNFENIGLIKLIFPNAKIISVRRDARDIAVSNYFIDYAGKHGGMGFAYDLAWIGEQIADHDALMRHWQQVFAGEILEVHYEDIVDDPATGARRMLDYIGVAWESQVLDFHTLERPVKTASNWQVRQPLYTGSKQRWRHYPHSLAPLVDAVGREICNEPSDMATLPEPGWLNVGVDLYRTGDLDGAERCFDRLLRYVPEHAAACFMLGLVYVRKGHYDDGIALMERALERCPWKREWRDDLRRAYRLVGSATSSSAHIRDAELVERTNEQFAPSNIAPAQTPRIHLDSLLLSG